VRTYKAVRTFICEGLAAPSRSRDSALDAKPGCAVLAAVASGPLEATRLESSRKLRAGAAYEERRSHPQARASPVAEHKTALQTMERSDGTRVNLAMCDVFEMRDGMIRKLTSYLMPIG
jgi:hypothetical protein